MSQETKKCAFWAQGSDIAAHISEEIVLFGEIIKATGSEVLLETADNKTITVQLAPEIILEKIKKCCLFGKVMNPEKILANQLVDMGVDFDSNLYEQTLKLLRTTPVFAPLIREKLDK